MEIPRYLKSFTAEQLKIIEADLLIVGSGIAGLYTAIKAGERKTIVITKEKTKDSSTDYAQGGIAAVLSDQDSPQLHIEDTLKAGADLCYLEAVKALVEEGAFAVRELISMGTNFDRFENTLNLTREGAHSRPRILHARGDATGEQIRKALVRSVLHLDWVDVFEDTFALDIILDEKGIASGVLAYDRPQKEMTFFKAKATVIATGGAGLIYQQTSNPLVTTGDGLAMAYRAGADLMDMEFVQFHPTAMYSSDEETFLVSEAVRGEGGILRNHQQQRFMTKIHPQGELAPRDIVARAIFAEMKKSAKPYVWLDVTHFETDFFPKRFPKIYRQCQKNGINPQVDFIPVQPAAHYFMGGIKTDLKGRTNIPGLYCCGEAAANGVHGANRLASNSLLEGLVFGGRIAKEIEALQNGNNSKEHKICMPNSFKKHHLPSASFLSAQKKMRKTMSEEVAILRDGLGLKKAMQNLEQLSTILDSDSNDPLSWQTSNLLLVAYSVTQSALKREESRGSHFRTDFPQRNPSWDKKHLVFNKHCKEGTEIVL